MCILAKQVPNPMIKPITEQIMIMMPAFLVFLETANKMMPMMKAIGAKNIRIIPNVAKASELNRMAFTLSIVFLVRRSCCRGKKGSWFQKEPISPVCLQCVHRISLLHGHQSPGHP